jgi:hypothetical protein
MTRFVSTPPETTQPPDRPGNDDSTQSPYLCSTSTIGSGRLVVVPVSLRTARAFIAWTHRHLLPPRGAKFAIGVNTEDGTLVGVATAGRPVARAFDDGFTIEITRLATDGTPNACSALLRAVWRTAKAMGYSRLITYTRSDEPGTSLRAAGFCRVADRPARNGWDTPSRPRTAKGVNNIGRTLWEIAATEPKRSRAAAAGRSAEGCAMHQATDGPEKQGG